MPADRITPPPSPQHALHLIEILLRTYVPKNTPDWHAWQAAVAILKASNAGVPVAPTPQPTADDAMALAMHCSGLMQGSSLLMSKAQVHAFAQRVLNTYGVAEAPHQVKAPSTTDGPKKGGG